MANNPLTMPTIANTKAATGCQVWEKCIIVALPLIVVAIVAVVSLNLFIEWCILYSFKLVKLVVYF
jgi:hypothetical protein